MDAFSDRLKLVLENEGLNTNQLGKLLGYSRSQIIYDLLNGKTLPKFDFFFRFLSSKKLEKYNPVWLITGKGAVYRGAGNVVKMSTILEPEETYQVKSKEEIIKMKDEQIRQLQEQIKFLQHIIEEKL